MIKVAYIIESFANKAGMERVLAIVANTLCENIEVTIVTASQNGLADAFELNKDIHRIDLGVQLDKKSYRRGLQMCLENEKFDVVVSMGGMDSYFVTEIADGSKKILWYHFAYDYYKALFDNRIVSWAHTLKRNVVARKFDCIVALNESDTRKWSRLNSVKKISNPCSMSVNKSSTCENHKVIAVGRLDRLKGFDMLIDAWKIVSEECKEWTLDVYGDGGLRTDLEAKINEYGLNDYIHLCGSTNEIEDKYLNSSLLVCSSRAEAFGLMIVEAESCGLPVVTFDCPSAPRELVVDGENGIVVPMGDVNGLASAVVKLLRNEVLRKRMGKKSVELSARFNVDMIKPKWMALFDELMRG